MTERLKPFQEQVACMLREEMMRLEEEFLAEVGRGGDRWACTPRQTEILEGLKVRSKERGLWSFRLMDSERGYGLTTVEYVFLAEETGKAHPGAGVFNCLAPDNGIR